MKPNVTDALQQKKINDLTKSIRKKYLALKLGKSEEDETLQKLFKPVVTPLKQIASQTLSQKSVPSQPIKRVEKMEEDYVPLKQSVEKFPEFLKVQDIASTSKDSEEGDGVFNENDTFKNESADEMGSRLEDISMAAMEDYINQYPLISWPYITDFWRESEKIDRVYGPIYDSSSSKWQLGKKHIDFEKSTGNIIIDTSRFQGTPGLYELLFYVDPQYTQSDQKEYKNILDMTEAHHDARGRLKHSRLSKYINTIRPLYKGRSHTLGTGLDYDNRMYYNKKPMEYVYWDDPNELVDRLKLLLASKDSGNTSHDNEIVAIINELKEANIIR